MLVDSVRLRVRGGRGGRGAATFRAQPFEPRGGPDGGDGGRGGAVVLQASGSLETLQPFVRRPLLTAAAGLPGGGGRKEGRKGEDLVLEVPVGTAVADGPGGEPRRLVGIPPGDNYVRHLDRARVVVYVLDVTEPDPAADLARLREIVQARRPAGGPPEVIVLNKVDEPAAVPSRLGYPVSAMTGAGLEEFVAALAEAVRSAPRPEPFQRAPRTRLKPVREATLQVWRRDWGFEVSGPAVERLLERTDLDRPDGFDRFQAGLDRLGVSRALEEAGVAPGDTVRIGTTEFEYQPG